MKVLHVLGALKAGGAELRTIELCEHIGRSFDGRVQFGFLTLSESEGELRRRCEGAGFSLFEPTPGTPRAAHILRAIRRFGPDVLHSHVYLYSGFVLLMGRCCRSRRLVAHLRNERDEARPSLTRLLYKRAARTLIRWVATDVVAVSRAAMDGVLGDAWRNDPRARVIPNGLSIDRFFSARSPAQTRSLFGIAEDASVVVHVGNFRQQKNQEFLMSVFRSFRRRTPNSVLLFVGDNQTTYGERVRACGGEGRVRFLGSLPPDEVASILIASDVFCFPSLWEGLPGALLEACAVGLPVLASAIAPHCEVRQQFPEVELAELRLSPEEWAERLWSIASNRLRPRLDAALERFTSTAYSMDRAGRAFMELWNGAPGC